MRRLLYILLLLLPLFACTRELNPVVLEEPVDDAPEGTVSVTFSFAVPAEEPATKALGESSGLNTMHLAIFGSSGFYKEYVKATMCTDKTYPVREKRTFPVDDEGNKVERYVDVYAFKADLKLSNTERVIHFIGNGPATIRVGNAKEVLPSELSGEGKTGFWQMVRLPSILAKTATKDGKEYYVDQHGGVYGDDPEDRYVISDETKKYFQYHLEGYDENKKPIFSTEVGIPLIRNWSKVCLKNNPASNFTPISFAVVHVPKQGTLVPYGAKTETGFITDYQIQSFTDLTDPDGQFAYKGNLPEKEDLFDETIPAAKYFNDLSHNPSDNVKPYDPRFDINSSEYALDPTKTEKYDEDLSEDDEPAVYLYERPVPTENMQPSFVIVYGVYLNTKKDPIFSDNNRGAGWPERKDYNPKTSYPQAGEKTKDGSLTFKEYYEGVKCYYKVDFMAGGEYYPILRNFKYQVEIQSISARGFSTPEDAAHSAGSADVSADINAAHLADISDGTRRMAIQPWMAQTFIEADDPDAPAPVHLHVKFIDDIYATDGGVNYDTYRKNKDNEDVECVTWSFIDGDKGVISSVSIGAAPHSTDSDVDGWRPISFRVLEPDNRVAKAQTLRISCMSYRDSEGKLIAEEQPLYRDIVITLQPKQAMRVQCERESIPRQPQEKQTVTISIPDGLPSSMFPLEFILEPEEATLTPSTEAGTENLPVISGLSIIPEKAGKSAVQFKRTVTWDEYKNTKAEDVFSDESRWRSFSCHFITNCTDNKTEIWVADKGNYFLAGNDNEQSHSGFTNFSSFHTPVFKTSIPRKIWKDNSDPYVKVETGVYSKDLEGRDADFFIMETVNLEPVSAVGATISGENGLYTFVPSAETITFSFKTLVEDGDISLKFRTSDDSYEEASLAPWRFQDVGIVDGFEKSDYGSDVAYGYVPTVADKYFLVKCLTDTKNADPEITVKYLYGVKDNSESFTSYGRNYREKWFQTKAGIDPISLTLSALGYVEETVSTPRYRGDIYSWDIPGSSLATLIDNDVVITQDVEKNGVTGSFSLKITSTGGTPVAHESGIQLPAGGHYIIHASIGSSKSDVFFYYAQIYYLTSDSKPYDSNVEPSPDGSLYSPYLGNEYMYMWYSIPWGETGGSLDIDAKRDVVISRMILRGFRVSPNAAGGNFGFEDDLNNGGAL